LISVAEARAIILENAQPLAVERVALRAAFARTLREDIVADRPHPPFHASAMDGYALRAADTPGSLTPIGEAGAGRALRRPLGEGECARIFTGAPLPDGADTVLIQEEAERSGDKVIAPAIERGRHVRAAGVDFGAGQSLLSAGRVLDAAALALAGAAGRPTLQVSTLPRVAILSGGDEIVPPGAAPAPDQIFDSVSFGVAALAQTWGGQSNCPGPFTDNQRDIADAAAGALTDHDVTVIIGGASVGDHDHARPALRSLGGELLFEKVALRPGKPTWFARLGDKLVLGLPGNPASAFVCARLFLRPLLDRLCGRNPAQATCTHPVRTRRPLAVNGPRETYLRARVDADETGQSWAEAAVNQDSSLISVLAETNALIVRMPNAPAAPAASLVEILNF
jgi:molybdopterin molybdotransferase